MGGTLQTPLIEDRTTHCRWETGVMTFEQTAPSHCRLDPVSYSCATVPVLWPGLLKVRRWVGFSIWPAARRQTSSLRTCSITTAYRTSSDRLILKRDRCTGRMEPL